MQANSHPELSKAALARVGAIIIGGLLLIGLLFMPHVKDGNRVLQLKAYFKNAEGLGTGAPVRVSGVEVGTVSSVRVRPEHREAPVEVVLRLHTPYSVLIPKDSVAELATAGVLGETFVNIDITKGSAPAAQSGDELKVAEVGKPGEFEFYFGSRRKDSNHARTSVRNDPSR
jgi:phospholipid/cholesterol/gamma-HCH transport system substrate-binding protein